MNASEVNPVELRIRLDWNHLYTEKYFLDDFAVTLISPTKVNSSYLLSFYIAAPSTIYNEKPYQVLLYPILVHNDLWSKLSL